MSEPFDFDEEHRLALVEEVAAGVPVRIVRLAGLLKLKRRLAVRRISRISPSFACCTRSPEVRDEIDWSLTTWEGNRRRQHREFLALSFRDKLKVIEQLGEAAGFFAGRRQARGPQAATRRSGDPQQFVSHQQRS